MDYAVISPEILYWAAGMIRSVIGTLFSVGIYIFMLLLGLHVFLDIINSIGHD